MSDTKENILLTALRLFARNGYEAVSVSDIAGALGMTKGALYKHYANKRDIFDSIVARMEQTDAQRAKQYKLPEGKLAEMEEAYGKASLSQVLEFGRSQFHYWTEDEFPAAFRKMLTLEQYRSAEMQQIYQQYLAAGPTGYITDLFRSLKVKNAQKKAAELYGAMFLHYSMYDGAEDKAAVVTMLEQYMDSFSVEFE